MHGCKVAKKIEGKNTPNTKSSLIVTRPECQSSFLLKV